MGRQDYEGAPMDGVTGDVAGSSTSDYGSSQSLGQMGSGESFSGADVYGGGEAEQQIRQAVSDVRQQYMDRPAPMSEMGFGTFSNLASRGGAYDFGGGGFSLEGLLGGQYNISDLVKMGFNNHPIVQAGRYIGQNASRQLMEGLQKGYKPQYNAIGQIVATYDPETGRYGAGSVKSRIDPNDPRNQPVDIFSEDNSDPDISESTAVAVIEEPEPEVSMIDMDYRYPAGGIYPEEGRFLRRGLLDVAPVQFGGLLRDYDPTQFAEMNVGFRRPTDVSLFQDPYDVRGYTLLS